MLPLEGHNPPVMLKLGIEMGAQIRSAGDGHFFAPWFDGSEKHVMDSKLRFYSTHDISQRSQATSEMAQVGEMHKWKGKGSGLFDVIIK